MPQTRSQRTTNANIAAKVARPRATMPIVSITVVLLDALPGWRANRAPGEPTAHDASPDDHGSGRRIRKS
jgi:hypothetical protein